MAKIDFLKARMNKDGPYIPEDFFDRIMGPPVSAFFTQQDHDYIWHTITHNRSDMKMKILNGFMKSKGFSRISAGTNRVVYRFLDDPSFVLKVAIDRVGTQDNLLELKNQQYLKPYVCKIFNTTPDGLMATIERVYPITSKEEFQAVEEEIYTLITTKLIGKMVADDIGKIFFKNYGIRPGFGPVLLDYPYFYFIDGSKLFCTHINPETNIRCDGIIDYDVGFNFLYCPKCGTRYFASDLEDKNPRNDIIISRGGKYPMKVRIVNADGVVFEPISSATTVQDRRREKFNREKPLNAPKIRINGLDIADKKEEEIKEEVSFSKISEEKQEIHEEESNKEIISEEDTSEEITEEETSSDESYDEEDITSSDDHEEEVIVEEKPPKPAPKKKATSKGKANTAGKASVKSKFIKDEE